eukprot:NODE_755_length_4533_cov_0.124041.p2 type:complete len:199 gc:universal NODE_755_length_4533_cov_0.124041:3725-3129(-)
MRKFFKSNKIECACTFTIETLENVPYMNGKFYATAVSNSGTFKSNISDVNQHQVELNFTSIHTLKCTIPALGIEVEPQYIKCKVYHITSSKTIKLGRITLNVTEYLSEPSFTKRFLLQEAKENITVLCTLNTSTNSYDAVSDAESSYITSAIPTPQTFELSMNNIEKLIPHIGQFKTSEDEINALLDPLIEFKLKLLN